MLVSEKAPTNVNGPATKAFFMAVIGTLAGLFAYDLEHASNQNFLVWTVGALAGTFYVWALVNLVRAASRRTHAGRGRNFAGYLAILATVTILGAALFVLCSLLAHSLMAISDPGILVTLVGLFASLIPIIGPLFFAAILGIWLFLELTESGWNVVFTVGLSACIAIVEIILWYAINLEYGPALLGLLA